MKSKRKLRIDLINEIDSLIEGGIDKNALTRLNTLTLTKLRDGIKEVKL